MADYPISAERAKIYSYRQFFSPLQASMIMLGYDPIYTESVRFSQGEQGETAKLLKDTLEELAFNGFFKDYKTDVYLNFNEEAEYITNISANELKEWALSNGYQWLNETTPTTESTDTKKDERIAELETALSQALAEIEQLKQAQEKADIVSYDQCSIYGHYSENIEIIFRLSKQIAEKCDIDNLHSYPEKKHIAEYVKEYHSDSAKLAEAIYQVITPEKVKNKGRTPKGMETFQGFLKRT